MSDRLYGREELDNAVWGTGYGRKRHLIDHAGSRLKVADYRSYHDEIRSACRPMVYLSHLDSREVWRPTVYRRQPCARCAKLAEGQR